jgi:hypothetical protein
VIKTQKNISEMIAFGTESSNDFGIEITNLRYDIKAHVIYKFQFFELYVKRQSQISETDFLILIYSLIG